MRITFQKLFSKMIDNLRMFRSNVRGGISIQQAVGIAVSVLLVGILFPIGLAAIEDYVPTDPTLLIIWPLVGVFAVLGVAVTYIRGATD